MIMSDPAKRPEAWGNYNVVLRRFRVSGFCVFSDRIVIHVKISFSATTIVASGMKTNEKRQDEGVDTTLSLFLSSSLLFEEWFFILATGGRFNDTNIIAFSERRFSPHTGHRFTVFLPPVFKKLSFFFYSYRSFSM